MGAIWFRRVELIGTVTEIVGYKSGIALSLKELQELSGKQTLWSGPPDQNIRIRSEEFETIIHGILYAVGNIPFPRVFMPGMRIFHQVKDDEDLMKTYLGVHELFNSWLTEAVKTYDKGGTKTIDPTPFIEGAKEQYGIEGTAIALGFVKDLILYQHSDPWHDCRRQDWKDVVELEELFRSESLETLYGTFFDQRFIDYLDRDFDSVDRINWRKFEGFVAEYFQREGFYVEIGKGRNDEGVDIRVWSKHDDPTVPPAILIQCKRQKDKVEKVVVKALYADTIAEQAESGLIVTTSALSPGARKVCTARGYAIHEADRGTLKQWLKAMRTPSTGIFAAE